MAAMAPARATVPIAMRVRSEGFEGDWEVARVDAEDAWADAGIGGMAAIWAVVVDPLVLGLLLGATAAPCDPGCP